MGSAGKNNRKTHRRRSSLPVIPSNPLPSLYAKWMDQLLAGPIPIETDATCDDCAMCAGDDSSESNVGLFYNPETKCCTYVPTIPNFLVGRILSDEDPAFAAGRETVIERLHGGVSVTPLGLGMPPTFSLLYRGTADKSFGISRTLRCPHYRDEGGGRCGVWAHRTAVCTTWFCKHVRGAVGANFWRTLLQLLTAVEQSLAAWCLLELGVEPESLRLLVQPRTFLQRDGEIDGKLLDGKVDRGGYQRVWGKWLGNEAEFYKQAGAMAGELDWKTLVALSGPEVKIHQQLLKDAYRKLISAELPSSLAVGTLTLSPLKGDSFSVTTYSPLDPLQLHGDLLRMLSHFDGRSIKETLKSIAAETGVRPTRDLIQKLVDFEVLVPPKPNAA